MKRKAMKSGKDKRKFTKTAMREHKKNQYVPRGGFRL